MSPLNDIFFQKCNAQSTLKLCHVVDHVDAANKQSTHPKRLERN
jgi:hypothetical protein